MGQRVFRELSDETKRKISDAMKRYHHDNRNNVEANRKTSAKRSEALKRYWERIPSRKQGQGATIQDIML